MKIEKYIVATALIALCAIWFTVGYKSAIALEVDTLTKEIDRLKPYEEMYKVMADSVGNIHSKCFRIGE